MEDTNSEDFFERLETQLQNSTVWPSDYLYKFIVPTDASKIQAISSIFDSHGAVIQTRKSKNGKYTSVSVTVNLKDPAEVIAIYKEVAKIEGVISL